MENAKCSHILPPFVLLQFGNSGALKLQIHVLLIKILFEYYSKDPSVPTSSIKTPPGKFLSLWKFCILNIFTQNILSFHDCFL